MDYNPPRPQDEKEILSKYEGDDAVISSAEMKEFLDNHPQNIVQFKSGIPTLDSLTEGFEGGELIVVSGPTKHGKSLLCQSITRNMSNAGIKALWFSYEMPVRQLIARFGDNPPLFYLPKRLKGRADTWLREKMLEAKLKYGVRAVFIDHLHFLIDLIQLRSPSLEIGAIVRKLKRIAMELNIVIFLVAHLTKTELDHEPNVNDIRDSSLIAQECDCLFTIHRLRDKATNEFTDEAKLIVQIHRRTGVMSKPLTLMLKDGFFVEKIIGEVPSV